MSLFVATRFQDKKIRSMLRLGEAGNGKRTIEGKGLGLEWIAINAIAVIVMLTVSMMFYSIGYYATLYGSAEMAVALNN